MGSEMCIRDRIRFSVKSRKSPWYYPRISWPERDTLMTASSSGFPLQTAEMVSIEGESFLRTVCVVHSFSQPDQSLPLDEYRVCVCPLLAGFPVCYKDWDALQSMMVFGRTSKK